MNLELYNQVCEKARRMQKLTEVEEQLRKRFDDFSEKRSLDLVMLADLEAQKYKVMDSAPEKTYEKEMRKISRQIEEVTLRIEKYDIKIERCELMLTKTRNELGCLQNNKEYTIDEKLEDAIRRAKERKPRSVREYRKDQKRDLSGREQWRYERGGID